MSNEPLNSLFDSPTKPGLKELQWLNEGKNDGFVNILRDDAKHDKLVPVIHVPQSVINNPQNCLPGFLEWFESELTDDCYANVNAFFWRDNSYSEQAQKYNLIDPTNNKPLHKPINGQGIQKNLRWLNAVYTDLDIYKAGITQGEAFKRVIDMMDAKRIPPVSWVKNSGKGLWLFWALHPTRYHNKNELDNFPTYQRIQRQIRIIFNDLEGDSNAVDAARVSRIYGSRNHTSQTLVSLWQRTDANGNMARYTLDELERFFGTFPHRKYEYFRKREYSSADSIVLDWDRRSEKQTDGSRRQLGFIGRDARWELDIARFWTLVEVVRQKRIKPGHRYTHVKILAAILQHLYVVRKLNAAQQADAIEADANRVWGCFEDQPSYELAKVKDQLTSFLLLQPVHNPTDERLQLKHQTIADELKITTDEAAQLAAIVYGTRKNRHWPPAAGQAPISPKKATRADQAQIRRDYLARFYTRGNRPDYRKLANKIQEATGLDCSAPTARADWQAVFPPSRAKWITKSFIDP
jgi:hypothetical protein